RTVLLAPEFFTALRVAAERTQPIRSGVGGLWQERERDVGPTAFLDPHNRPRFAPRRITDGHLPLARAHPAQHDRTLSRRVADEASVEEEISPRRIRRDGNLAVFGLGAGAGVNGAKPQKQFTYAELINLFLAGSHDRDHSAIPRRHPQDAFLGV